MIRALTIPVALAALAVSAAPASAGLLSSPLGTSATTHLDDISLGTATKTASERLYVGETVGGRRIQKFLRR